MSFLEAIGDIGQALSGIPYGINAGLQPFGTWENIRTKDLANDRSEVTLQDLMLQQAAREGGQVPAFYGDWANSLQTGFQNTAAKNQLGTDTFQQQLALAEYMRSPEGQALIQGQTPGSYGFDMGLLQGASQFTPMQIPDMFKQYGMTGLDQQAAGQQVGEEMLRYQLQQMNPGAQIDLARMPGQGYVALVDGQPMQIPASLLRGAFAAEGIAGPQAAINAQINLQRAIQTGDMNMITQALKATEGYTADPALRQLTQLQAAGVRELTALQAAKTRLMTTYMPEEQKAAAMMELDAKIASRTQQQQGLEQMIVQRASVRRGGSLPITPVQSGPVGGNRALSFGPNGAPVTQVVSDIAKPIPDYADYYGTPTRYARGPIRTSPYSLGR